METHNFPLLHPEDFPRVPFVIDGISSRFIEENRVIPLDVRENKLWIVMARPEDTQVVDALRVASGTDVVVYSGDGPAIDEYIAKFYGQDGRIRLKAADREIDVCVSTIPILHGESVVMRILDYKEILNYASLGGDSNTLTIESVGHKAGKKTGFGVKAVIALDARGSFRYLYYKCPSTGSLQ